MISDKKQAKSSQKGYKRLVAWQLSDKFAWQAYRLTDKFPSNEMYGMTSQLRRAALSVPLNVVEGYSRNSRNEFRRFLNISLGSLAESGYLLDFACRRGYLTASEYKKILVLKEECGRVLWKLMKIQ